MSEGEYQASLADPEPWDDEDAICNCSALHPLYAPGYWTTGAGETLEITKMTDAHLRNAISWAEKFRLGHLEKIDELRAELAGRGL